jgi:hypothetical protein
MNMPSNQTAKSSSSRATGATQRKPPQAQPAARAQGGPRAQSQGQTGERDESYALISVLYHALQGAETIDQYIRDARAAEDEELATFFEETKEAYVERAAEAKELLASRLESEDEDEADDDDEASGDDEDDEDEEDEEED